MTNEKVDRVAKYFEPSPTILPPRQETQEPSRDSSGSNLFNKSEMKQTINVNANFTLDGTVIDRKIVKVVDGMAQNAIDDISSSTGG